MQLSNYRFNIWNSFNSKIDPESSFTHKYGTSCNTAVFIDVKMYQNIS